MAAIWFRARLIKNLPAKQSRMIFTQQLKSCKKLTVVSKLQNRLYNVTACVMKQKEMKIRVIKDNKERLQKVDVWENMTAAELARTSSRDIEDVLQTIKYHTRVQFDSDYVFKDKNLIGMCLKSLNLLPKFVVNPILNKKSEIDTEKEPNIANPPPDPSVLIKRRPIVTVMGHVDHGKTTLLDTLRNTNVVKAEFGGITQHIGAFNVTLETGEKITFLDTPGHAAFSAMRLRGASVTDIVILVVAADDGVMEQTVQSIEMAKTSKVPIIVAINKIDKPEADIQRTKIMLAQHSIHLEDLGGDVQSVNISALKNQNLNLLMEAVVAQAEIMELKGDPKGKVEGVIIECSTSTHRGKLATVLIKRGILKRGDYIVSGTAFAKVRSMFDHAGNIVKQATLCDPVQIIGWREMPNVGDEVQQVDNEQIAHKVVHYRKSKELFKKSLEQDRAANEKLQKHLIEYKAELKRKRSLGLHFIKKKKTKETEPDDGIPKMNIIIKADVVGSVEAILDTLETYNEEKKCHLNVVHFGVGEVNESDIELSQTFNAIIYCFNVKKSRTLKKDVSNKSIRFVNVIYKLIDDLKEEITKLLPNVTVEDVIGEADILKEFEINVKKNKVKVAGCMCSKGELKKMANYKVIRNDEVIYTGKLKSMRHMKEEVTSIKTGMECGLMMDNPDIPFQQGDKVICFTTRQVRGTLNWNTGF